MLPKISTASKVVELQKIMYTMPQLDLEEHTKEYLFGGMYMRMLFRPAGCIIVGRTHKKEHFYMVWSGTVEIATEQGPVQYTGPCVVEAQPGSKRAVHAVTDAYAGFVVRTDKTVIDEELQKELIEEEEYVRYDAHNRIMPLVIEETKVEMIGEE